MNCFQNEDSGKSEEKKAESKSDLSEKLMKTRQLILSGEVDKELAEKIVNHLFLLEADSDKPIYIFIDSPGGDVDSGFAIYDMIRFVNAPVFTVGMGLVASAGALIFLAAEKSRRLALPNSHFLIHQPLGGMRGVASDIEIHAQEIEKMKAKLNRLVADETGKKLDDVAADMERDHWMSADEALAYNIVGKIIKSRKDLENL